MERGGQNLLEPLAWGVPVTHGPHMEDFRELAVLADRAGLSRTILDAGSLSRAWGESLAKKEERVGYRTRCEAFLEGIGGASVRAWEKIASENKKLLWE